MNRRRFLQTTAAAALLHESAPAAAPATRIVDTHTHFYDPSRPGGVPWPGKGSPLYRTVLPADWLAVAAPHGVKETVVVEASPLVEDNQWIFDLAAKEKSIVGFVGHLDPGDAFADHLKRFAANPIFRGVRWSGTHLQDTTKQNAVLAGAKALAEHGLELDLNGGPTYLPHAAKLATDVTDLRIVINHLGASGDPQSLRPEWKENIRAVAKLPNVLMKVSALVEQVKCEYGKAPQDTAYYLPILDHLWESFGPDRLIYGSDWPVSDKGASYDVVFKVVDEFFRSKGSEACEKYFWKNSLAAYRWIERQ
ncbi:amidohydrolase family protein [Prosthecobacter vanneervenii]|uniref:Putative TIM-barrel fold metal-dependent hydrolase n=1 Tax=Prosthecobacter vanneervenii TaxID=48466 RepID=A0A7W8DLJ7_9BACT|nr:amidohydrolase family protein [Prosthecobacter vanneervenii]MBB5034232.1 putative TIM-barrel fold metal-dependent hydrolase [Prosthecobacter vanneervenii]